MRTKVEATLAIGKQGDRLDVVASGRWIATNAGQLETLVDAAIRDLDGGDISIDLQNIDAIDSFGVRLLERLIANRAKLGKRAEVSGLSDQYQGLFTAVGRVNGGSTPSEAPRTRPFAFLETLGKATIDGVNDAAAFAAMLGAVVETGARCFVRPKTFRMTSFVFQLDRVGFQATGIIALITLLIGAIIAQQGFFHFRKFGAQDYSVDLVGILVLRELGVLMVSIMVAGRSGSSYTAELGAMKMREELDALKTMGLDPVMILILPRIVALIVAVPILTLMGSMFALLGGGVVAWLYGGMYPAIYIARIHDAISITHFDVGMIKAPFMALVIGVVACVEGLRVTGSAESLGQRTTASVVKSIFLVIVLDGLFAIFFASIGM
jgi:phospholipid/cholesterol/gamma-HCH transport system permease protein